MFLFLTLDAEISEFIINMILQTTAVVKTECRKALKVSYSLNITQIAHTPRRSTKMYRNLFKYEFNVLTFVNDSFLLHDAQVKIIWFD